MTGKKPQALPTGTQAADPGQVPSAGEQPLAEFRDVRADVTLGNGQKLVTVDGVSLTINHGQSYAIVGKSGSGKTSLISILGLLNNRFTGEFFYQGQAVHALSDHDRSLLRAAHIGFVFQNYSLIKHLKVVENIELALNYQPRALSRKERHTQALDALAAVGLEGKATELPSRLSGGEQQRVAMARALAGEPDLLICDEPTGALDHATGKHVLSLLHRRVKESGAALVLVTHDPDVAATCSHIYNMDEGRITRHGNAD